MTATPVGATLPAMHETAGTVRGARRLSVLLGIGAILGACGGPPPSQTTASEPPPPAPTARPTGSNPSARPTGSPAAVPASSAPIPSPDAVGVLLSEVLVAPQPGAPAFVEVANTTTADVDLTGMVVRIGAADVALSTTGVVLASGGRLSVGIEGAGAVLDARGGSAVLLDASGATLDIVAWGDAPNAVESGPGGLVPEELPAGASIGRAPGADQPGERLDWVVYPPAETSPGAPNPLPRVEILLPMDGASLDVDDVVLTWYGVVGATGYRVQIATDDTFGNVVADRTVTDAEASVDDLVPGSYAWRVASVGPDGVAAAWSDPNDVTLDDGVVAAGPPAGTTVEARFAPAVDPPPVKLPVPYLTQHKDTKLLLLESKNEKGAHAWDADHVVPSRGDPADTKNCVLAAVAIMNRYFGGDVSQDRLGYEVFKDRVVGPERDLNYGTGLSVPQATVLLDFALQAAPREEIGYLDYDDAWKDLTTSIKAGRPVMGANTHHTFVITGFQETAAGRVIWYHDPANGRDRRQNIDTARLSPNDLTLWIPAPGSSGRRQEPSVKADSDGDQVRDFDETVRFHTDPADQDSDDDKLKDYADIVTGVYDARHGYAVCCSAGRDWDSDGIPTERDKDSDDGGCWDGEEDTSGDGHKNGRETDNFDIDDDPCIKYDITITWRETYGDKTDEFKFVGQAGNVEPSAFDDGSVFLTGTGTVSGSRAAWAGCSVDMDVPSGNGPAFFGATIVGDTVTVSAYADFVTLAGVITQPFEMPKDGGTRSFSGGFGGEVCSYSWRAKVIVTKLPAH